MSDLISRQWLLDLYGTYIDGDVEEGKALFVPLEVVRQNIKDAPSAEPKTGWIPVSERLPSEDGEYLGAYPMELGETETEVDILNYGKPTIPTEKVCGRCWYDTDTEYGDVVYDDVVAWMPLPEPYREDDEA